MPRGAEQSGAACLSGSGRGEAQPASLSRTTPALSIALIVPVHNGGENFRTCLSSLTTTVPPPRELIVVADGDTDNSGLLAEEFGAQVLRISPRGGPAQARNLGARAASSDILFFVDADVTLPTNALSQVVTAFAREPDLAAVFGSYDDEPAATNFLSQYKNLFHHYVHQTAREEACTFWGACGAIRREVFLALGGFDEQYRWPSVEDIALGYGLTRVGQKIRLCKTLQVKHLKRWGITSLLQADFCYRALPWSKLILQERRLPNDLNLRLSSRVSVVLTYGLLITGVGRWWWPGSFIVAGIVVLVLLTLNASLYRFFWRKRGLWFAVQTVPWHWLYYFYSGLAFAISLVFSLFPGNSPPKANAAAVREGQSPLGKHRG